MAGYVPAVSSLGLAISIYLAGCSGVQPSNLVVTDGRLSPCPATPNCVSSQSTDPEHAIEPLAFSTTTDDAFAALKNIVMRMKRVRIVSATDKYLHAEFASAVWRFVDDAEFSLDESAKIIHVRSASRIGTSDFGVNRKRMEEIRTAWTALGK